MDEDSGGAICPLCLCGYSGRLKEAPGWGRKPGDRCRDMSHGQRVPCVGRVIPSKEFWLSEWFLPDDSESRVAQQIERHRDRR